MTSCSIISEEIEILCGWLSVLPNGPWTRNEWKKRRHMIGQNGEPNRNRYAQRIYTENILLSPGAGHLWAPVAKFEATATTRKRCTWQRKRS